MRTNQDILNQMALMGVPREQPDQIKRNLNPHRAAVVAMALFHAEYAIFGGGSMDFYDSLSSGQKQTCREIVANIEAAPVEPRGA